MGRRSGPICSSCLILPDTYHCRRCGSHIPAGQRVRTCSSSASLTDVWSQIQRDHRHVCREREGEAKIKRNNSEVRGSIKGEVGTSATVPLPAHHPPPPRLVASRQNGKTPRCIATCHHPAALHISRAGAARFSSVHLLHPAAAQFCRPRLTESKCRKGQTVQTGSWSSCSPHHRKSCRNQPSQFDQHVCPPVRLSACPPAVFAPPVAEILFLKICVFTRRPKSMTQPPGRRIRPHS